MKRTLSVGEPCPVCEQQVAKLPGKSRIPKVEALQEQTRAAEDSLIDHAEKLKAQRDLSSRASATVEKSAERARELRDAVSEQEANVARLEKKLEEQLGSLVGNKRGVTIEDRVLDAAKRQSDLRDRHEEAVAARDEAGKKLAALHRAVERVETSIATLAEKLETVAARASEHASEIRRVSDEVRKVTKRPDPLIEREEIASRCTALEKAVEDLRAKHRELSVAVGAEQATEKEIETQLGELRTLATRKRGEITSTLGASGFASEAAVRGAVVSAPEQKKLEKEIQDYRGKRLAAEQRTQELEHLLVDRSVTDEEFGQAQTTFTELRRQYEEGIRNHARLREQATELERKVGAAIQLTSTLEKERIEYRHYDQLATDLRSDRFQEFILREAFAELVARASQRLYTLSGRYTLEMHDGDFDVLDRDNAGERRSANTLSGGETFLASLALALELSEQVQRAAGAVVLDSLFIDEGFGSLDPEALDTAINAIQSLPQGGRMVGIITHIPELTARLDRRLVVEKRAEGSLVRLEAE